MSETDEILNDVVNGAVADRAGNEVNKAAAIRRALQILPSDSKPGDVVDYLKREHNLEVSGAYVSVIKGQLVRKINSQSFEAIRLARKLVKETGGILNARNALEAVQEEIERTASLRNLYEGQLDEIEARLMSDKDRPSSREERRELTVERKRLHKLLEALD